mgnify:CR=1 FL=1
MVYLWTISPESSVSLWKRTRRFIRFSPPSTSPWSGVQLLRQQLQNALHILVGLLGGEAAVVGPINQIVGYILSEDPTYITNHNNARTLIRKIDRDELLQVLVRKYLGQ